MLLQPYNIEVTEYSRAEVLEIYREDILELFEEYANANDCLFILFGGTPTKFPKCIICVGHTSDLELYDRYYSIFKELYPEEYDECTTPEADIIAFHDRLYLEHYFEAHYILKDGRYYLHGAR